MELLLAEEPAVARVDEEVESGCEVRPPKASVLNTHGASAAREELLPPPPPPPAELEEREEGVPATPPPPPPPLPEEGAGADGLLRLGFPLPSVPMARSSFSRGKLVREGEKGVSDGEKEEKRGAKGKGRRRVERRGGEGWGVERRGRR